MAGGRFRGLSFAECAFAGSFLARGFLAGGFFAGRSVCRCFNFFGGIAKSVSFTSKERETDRQVDLVDV